MSMMRQFGWVLMAAMVAGCALVPQQPSTGEPPVIDEIESKARGPEAAAPPPDARTAEQFDTTTAEDRAEVLKAAAAPAQSNALGTTVASLGDPSDPGFWLKTPLVTTEQPGRVEYAAAGTKVAVTLIPIDGPVTGGSRLSLPAMRLLEAPLTGLPEVTVFTR